MQTLATRQGRRAMAPSRSLKSFRCFSTRPVMPVMPPCAAFAEGGEGRRAAAGVLSALLLLSSAAGGAQARETLEGPARVVDGDTLYVQGQKIRLYAVDAPEKSQYCKDKQGISYACGQRALEALKTRVGSNPVKCDVKTKDQYSRSVAACAIVSPQGTEDIGSWLVSSGNAVAYRKISPEYIPQEERAKRGRTGIWEGQFTMPAKWRYEQRLATIQEGENEGFDEEDTPPPPPRRAPAPAPQQQQQPSQEQRVPLPLPLQIAQQVANQVASPSSSSDGSGSPRRSYADALGGSSSGGSSSSGSPSSAPAAPAAQAPGPARGSYADAAARGAAAPPAKAQTSGGGGGGGKDGCKIKGNINMRGEKIYHTPSSGAYDRVQIDTSKGERWFCSEQEAQAAGFRHSLK